jgi:hypothetical protein
MDLIANSRFRIHARWRALASVGTYAAPSQYWLRIRDTNVSGTIRKEMLVDFPTIANPYQGELSAFYETAAAETGKLWVFTAQRVSASGILTFSGGGAGVRLGMEVINEGHSGQLTQVTS